MRLSIYRDFARARLLTHRIVPSSYQSGRKLSGLIYMHRISDFRVGGISRRNFSMFRKLCGDETLNNVLIVTNMWSEVTPEKGAAREHELQTDDLLFAPVLRKGALMLRHDNSLATAQAIMRQIVSNRPKALAIQRELVDEGKDITETAAGVELDKELAAMRKKHMEELSEIQRDMEEALLLKDEETKKELEAVRADLLKNMEKIESDRDRLSQEFAQEKARADERVRKIQEDLDAEKAAREERQQEILKLTTEMENNRALNAREREQMNSQLENLKSQVNRGGGFFARIGRAIDRLF